MSHRLWMLQGLMEFREDARNFPSGFTTHILKDRRDGALQYTGLKPQVKLECRLSQDQGQQI